jgi:aminoglycoside/choline kinase family phosphotransferase
VFGALKGEDLAGDASTRIYRRLWLADGSTAVLVEYPASSRRELARDLEILRWCRQRHLAVPRVLDTELAHGRALLEDLGTIDAETALEELPTHRRPEFVTHLVTPLEHLAAIPPTSLPAWNRPLDRDRLRWELTGFELWYLRYLRGIQPPDGMCGWLDALADEVAGHPTRVCHRDYHLNNLVVSADGGLGVIDIQDILIGPDTYDAVSMLYERAATRLFSADQRSAALARWAERTGAAQGWSERARSVRLQRGLKVLGTFARFVITGRREYLHWMQDIAHQLVEPLGDVGAPPGTRSILLD